MIFQKYNQNLSGHWIHIMNVKNKWTLLLAMTSFFLLTGFFNVSISPEERRNELLEMRATTLKTLFKKVPQSESEIKNSVGYAVFSNIGINLLILSTGNGSGVIHNNKTGKDLFMKMLSGGVGLGLGVKDFRGVFIFSTEEAFQEFVTYGRQASLQADAAAKYDQDGDAASLALDVAPGVTLYQLTENGLAIQATLQGTKFWIDDKLNGAK